MSTGGQVAAVPRYSLSWPHVTRASTALMRVPAGAANVVPTAVPRCQSPICAGM